MSCYVTGEDGSQVNLAHAESIDVEGNGARWRVVAVMARDGDCRPIRTFNYRPAEDAPPEHWQDADAKAHAAADHLANQLAARANGVS